MAGAIQTTIPAYRTEADVSARLQELETQYDLFQYQGGGYCVWRLLRFRVAGALQNLPFAATPSLSTRRWIKERAILILPELFKLLFPRKAKFVVKTFSSALLEEVSGRYKDVYFDDLLEELGSCYKIKTLNNPIYENREKLAVTPTDITTTSIDLLAGLLARLQSWMAISSASKRISQILQSELALDQYTPQYIERVLKSFHWYKKIYGNLLRRIHPTHVLVADTGEYALLAAAHKLGIISIEFQHGVFSRNHPDALPSAAGAYRNSMVVPDKIFLFGEYWKAEQEHNQFYSRELVPVGSPRIDLYRKLRAAYLGERQPGDQRIILLTTQGIDRERLIIFIADFLHIAQGKLDISLYIKLHPSYEREKSAYELALGSLPNVHILLGSDAPSTFELLVKADFHMSISSASHYDAIGLGVPTIVLPMAGYETVIHLVKAGHASFVKTPDEMLDFILASQVTPRAPGISAYYFLPDGLQNINRELGRVP